MGVGAGRAGTRRLASGLFWTPRLRAVRGAAAPSGVRPPLGGSPSPASGGNAGGGGGGCAREVPRARLLAAGVEGIGRFGRWHRPSCGHKLVGGGGSRAGPVAPGSVLRPGRARVRPRVARGELRRDAGECFGGKVGGGGFSRKRAAFLWRTGSPACGRLCALGSPVGWCLVACPLGTAPPRAWSLELLGRLETWGGHAVCGGGMGLGVARAEQRGSPGPLALLRGIR